MGDNMDKRRNSETVPACREERAGYRQAPSDTMALHSSAHMCFELVDPLHTGVGGNWGCRLQIRFLLLYDVLYVSVYLFPCDPELCRSRSPAFSCLSVALAGIGPAPTNFEFQDYLFLGIIVGFGMGLRSYSSAVESHSWRGRLCVHLSHQSRDDFSLRTLLWGM
ncbi:uncharacterized protein G2W53_014043 [Senna tora]|uniref:Uncharacterized protein n=1 Tax=Senna tora TaxID=362788 RepID=A0A834WPY3_9FABA|nr:uncharacterized protein G2W53_014043 [Senna tora]